MFLRDDVFFVRIFNVCMIMILIVISDIWYILEIMFEPFVLSKCHEGVLDCCSKKYWTNIILTVAWCELARWRMVWMPKAGGGWLLGSGFLMVGLRSIHSRLENPTMKMYYYWKQVDFKWWLLVRFLECIYIYIFTYLHIFLGVSVFVYTLFISLWHVSQSNGQLIIDFPLFNFPYIKQFPQKETQILALEGVAWMGYTWRCHCVSVRKHAKMPLRRGQVLMWFYFALLYHMNIYIYIKCIVLNRYIERYLVAWWSWYPVC